MDLTDIKKDATLRAQERTTVISVSYNSAAALAGLLPSVPPAVAVVIVDNSPQASREMADLAAQSGATLVTNTRNMGFGVACNQGAAIAGSEFLFFVNPDAQLGKNAIEELVAAADQYPRASAFVPRVATATGKPDIKRQSNLMPGKDRMARGWPAQDQEITVATAAALLVRRSAFETVGGFDPQIFLYHEDDDLTLRLRRECGPLRFVGAAHVAHIGGASSNRSPAIARLKAWHMGRSRVYGARKHGQPWPFGQALVQAIWQMISPVNLVSARKRAKNTGFLRGVLSTRTDGGAGFREVE